jgi:DNA-binding CsgD family transcriptional regulator
MLVMVMMLHGFDTEFGTITDRLAAAEQGGGSIVLIEGAVGTGKTALLRAAVAAAIERKHLTLVGVDRPALSMGGVSFTDLPNACHIVPVLGDGPGVPRLRSSLAALRAGRLADPTAERRPLVVALDDLHELDPVSARTLGALPAHYVPGPVVWLLARRSGMGSQEVNRLFALGCGNVIQLGMAGLDVAATEAILTDTIGRAPSPELLTLAGRAGGNPLLVVELAKGLVEEYGPGIFHPGRDVALMPLPRRLAQAVDLLLSAVSPECRHVVELAAVLGGDIRIPRLAALSGEPAGSLLAGLMEAVRVGLLVTGADDELCFAHELLGMVLRRGIPAQVHCGDSGVSDHRATEVGRRGGRPLVHLIPAPPPREIGQLRTDTERVIAELVGEGLTNQQIASRLILSPHTVNYHLRKIFLRLGVRSRAELAVRVRQHRQSAG